MNEYRHMFELLEAVGKTKTAKAKAELLKANDCLGVRDILKGSFDPTLTFNWIPKGNIPYTPAIDDHESLFNKTPAFKWLVDDGEGKALSQAKREQIFINLLESIHPKDAELVIIMKDKALKGKYKGLTVKLCNTVWGGLITE
jgi:hypothetical protein